MTETNRIIHEWLHPEMYYHERRGFTGVTASVPDYAGDLHTVREAELKAIEMFGDLPYYRRLELTRCPTNEYIQPNPAEVATAPADVRAEAVRLLILEAK